LFKLSSFSFCCFTFSFCCSFAETALLTRFSKSFGFSLCCSVSDTAQLTQLFKTFQFKFHFYCSVSAIQFQITLCLPVFQILSVSVFAVQSPFLLFHFRYCPVSTVVQTFSFSFCCLVPDTALHTQSSKTFQLQLCCSNSSLHSCSKSFSFNFCCFSFSCLIADTDLIT
jgi:hypothetical protein